MPLLTPEEAEALERVRHHFDEWWAEAEHETYHEPRDLAALAFLAGVAAVAKPH